MVVLVPPGPSVEASQEAELHTAVMVPDVLVYFPSLFIVALHL